jgi:hypothetical protein
MHAASDGEGGDVAAARRGSSTHVALRGAIWLCGWGATFPVTKTYWF